MGILWISDFRFNGPIKGIYFSVREMCHFLLSVVPILTCVIVMFSRAKERDRATTRETIRPPTSGATWWRQMRITTTSGRTRDATACLLARSTAESSRTPTRTTRTPIRMHTSLIAIAVHRAATAMTPGTGSEPTSVTTGGPDSTRNIRCNRAKTVPNCTFLFRLALNCFVFFRTWLFFSLKVQQNHVQVFVFQIKLPGQLRPSTSE